MRQLPITLGLMTSTKGHWSRTGDFRITLDHWDRQIPLRLFNLVAHVKVSPGQGALGEQMADELRSRGFHVITTIGGWVRGLSHGAAYLADQARVSMDPMVHRQPFFLLAEDDSPAVALGCSLEDLLLRSCHLLATNHELVTVRLIRQGDYDGGVPQLADAEGGRAFYSPHTDFQPLVMRSLDFYRLGMALEANPEACARVQCEALWAHVLSSFSRSPRKHLVWRPSWAHTAHIGVPQPEHEAVLRALGLTPAPTP